MIYTPDYIIVQTEKNDTAAQKASELFIEELRRRHVECGSDGSKRNSLTVIFENNGAEKDCFGIVAAEDKLILKAGTLRAFIFAYSMFLRKTTYSGGRVTLMPEMTGSYAPAKPIRGHQLGYRPKNNTYDAWSPEDFRRYYLDMMAFGSNIAELMPGGTDDAERNGLMQLDPNEMLIRCSEMAQEVDIDVSLWYPNCEKSTVEESAEIRDRVFRTLSRLDYVFPPGGDPGDYAADEFLDRAILAARKLKESHPTAEMWPSAQKPKRMRNWGPEFVARLKKDMPDEIGGVITGPNRAFTLDELRRRLPMKYPIRLYPDITHNVRCEYPVHVLRDDWHFAFASTMGRESVNPRPTEYRRISELARRYTVGSVSYSEGCNDDINKMVWGWLEYCPETDLTELLEDYARFFFPGADAAKAAGGILALEKNWFGDPAENPLIEATLAIWEELLHDNPELMENWRFVSCLFRARGDAVIRRRRVFELGLLKKMRRALASGDLIAALDALAEPYDSAYTALRASLHDLAEILFRTIGLQLNVEDFHASAPDRGAVLETIDKPITDVAYYRKTLSRIAAMPTSERTIALSELARHEHTDEDEFVFSVSTDTMERFGGKPLEVYLNFRGDGSNNDGELPVSLLGMYDSWDFKAQLGGFMPGCDYEMRVAYSVRRGRPLPPTELYVRANGRDVYRGEYYGAKADPEYDEKWYKNRYVSQIYELPADVFENGCLLLEMGEKNFGVEFSEIRITRKEEY